MRFLGVYLLLGGYVLVYAAVAGGGKFATDPWAGLFTDAYKKAPVGGIPTPPPTGRRRGMPFVVPPGFAPLQPQPSPLVP